MNESLTFEEIHQFAYSKSEWEFKEIQQETKISYRAFRKYQEIFPNQLKYEKSAKHGKRLYKPEVFLFCYNLVKMSQSGMEDNQIIEKVKKEFNVKTDNSSENTDKANLVKLQKSALESVAEAVKSDKTTEKTGNTENSINQADLLQWVNKHHESEKQIIKLQGEIDALKREHQKVIESKEKEIQGQSRLLQEKDERISEYKKNKTELLTYQANLEEDFSALKEKSQKGKIYLWLSLLVSLGVVSFYLYQNTEFYKQLSSVFKNW